jgi:hypothetical protein
MGKHQMMAKHRRTQTQTPTPGRWLGAVRRLAAIAAHFGLV